MRPLDPKNFKRSMTALATGLLVGAALVSPAAAQTAPTPSAKAVAAPVAAKPAAPKSAEAKPVEAAAPAAVAAPAAAALTTTAAKPAAVAPKASAKPAEAKPTEPKTTATAAIDKKALAGAKKAYGDATSAFKAAKYDHALLKFQEAQSLVPSANAEYWIAATLDKLDKQAEALAAYATFLANPELTKAGDDKVAESKARFDALRATVPGELVLTAVPADAKLSVDGQAQTEKSPWTLKLVPGDHKILVTADGFVAQEVTIGVEAAKRARSMI